MHPTAQISVANKSRGADVFEFRLELNNSGAINIRVPFMVDADPDSSSMRLLIPKSAILTHHGSGGQLFTRMFYVEISERP